MEKKQYWIKGDDGEDYGPVDIAEMREWVAENRAGIGTEVRADGEDEWLRWQDFPELVVLLAEIRAKRGGALFPHLPDVRVAAILPRVAAFLMDMILVLLLFSIALELVMPFLPPEWVPDTSQGAMEKIAEGESMPWPLFGISIAMMITIVAYFTVFHGAMGQTPGKRIFRVRVVDRDGLTIGYGQALMRGLGLVVSLMPYGLGCVMALFTRNRQAFHDWLAKTYVVAAEPPRREDD